MKVGSYPPATALLYVAPVVALLVFLVLDVVGGVNWTAGDFIVVAVLLFGAALMFDVISRKVHRKHRLAIGVGILAALALVWVELAVGLVGSPFAGS